MKTKAEMVREELKHGRTEGMLPELARAIPGLTVERLERIADGWSSTGNEIDMLFDTLGLGEEER